ncbi:hypothetical protein NDU88_000788 [Pleurodeles waltl]|uniref:Beta/gamma crystallin 'Greek key' domain-containing protein n=1 Tax=Pleurodeles waltl TaxID=8319 RepID=A0AAV7P3I2_PLEWA|nr:hypothetical protein NDU88_000788 [Pleurodeles waltl]
MNQITVYSGKGFVGLYRIFTTDVPDLKKENFNNCIASVKVVGQPWVMFDLENYKGQFSALEEGEYSSFGLSGRISSLLLISEDLNDPQITLYEHIREKGKRMVLTRETNLFFGSMNDTVSSHRVQRGAWLLYENMQKSGRCVLARAGQYVPDYGHIRFNDKLSHVYPLRPGRATITATILWDKKKIESERVVQLDQIVYNNNTGSEQAVTATSSKEFEKYISHSFTFSNETSIKVGASFVLKGVVNVSTELSNKFTVTKGENESTTSKIKVGLTMPVKILPYTKVTVSFLCKEARVSVPVELKIERSGKTDIETGTYRCDSGTDTFIDVEAQDIRKD